jgi:siroheme synthase-like protein
MDVAEIEAVSKAGTGVSKSVTLFPLFVKLSRRRVVVVGGGAVAASKLRALLDAGADVSVIAPDICPEIARTGVRTRRRAFSADDLDGAWMVIAAAPPAVNREVAVAAEARQLFVNAVDDRAHATAYACSVLRRSGVTVAISTAGEAPALAALLREGLEALLPAELGTWMRTASTLREGWKSARLAMPERRPALLDALNRLYGRSRAVPQP